MDTKILEHCNFNSTFFGRLLALILLRGMESEAWVKRKSYLRVVICGVLSLMCMKLDQHPPTRPRGELL